MILQLQSKHLDEMYQIWQTGTFSTFSSDTLDLKTQEGFYRKLLAQRITEQDQNFKIWGYFNAGKLLGWQSLLPCRSAPFVYKNYAESSTYVQEDVRHTGIGRQLLEYALCEARDRSDLMYVIGYVSEKNHRVHKLIQEVGFQKVAVLPRSNKDTILPEIALWMVPL